jgi:hypothetical protein
MLARVRLPKTLHRDGGGELTVQKNRAGTSLWVSGKMRAGSLIGRDLVQEPPANRDRTGERVRMLEAIVS